jgi:hypothetical protein
VSALVALVATTAYADSVAGLPAADAAAAIAAFRDVLIAVGTPSFSQVATTIGTADIRPYLEAYTTGLHAAFLFCGAIGVIGGAIALVAFGRQDPLKTVWDNLDERTAVAVGVAP